jgi:RNA polymerase sigma-70 factor (ECF subfamily)
MAASEELVWLLARMSQGDRSAFERLYAATRAKLYGVILRILRRSDLAEEAMQDTYLRIWQSAGRFDPALASPITWMVTIARNRALDIARRKPEVPLDDAPDAFEIAMDSQDPLAAREFSEDLKRVLGCLGQLDKDKQRLILLAYYDGWSREQLAENFGAPVATVKTWLRRSLMTIRECLGS